MSSVYLRLTLFSLALFLAGCAAQSGGVSPREIDPAGSPSVQKVKPTRSETPQKTAPPAPVDARSDVLYGKAAYYSSGLKGKVTASGERYDPNEYTAAHPSLPFNTLCVVTNLLNGRTVQVRINDRCSASMGRVLDLSRAAAEELDAIQAGIIEVKVEITGRKSYAN